MKRAVIVPALALAGGLGLWALLGQDAYKPRPLPELRPSSDFPSTVMVPALETPLPAGKNAVWCGAIQLAWNRLKSDVAKEPLVVKGAESLCGTLNGSAFGEADLAPGSFYAAAGRVEDGIVERIRREMADSFPGANPSLPPVQDPAALAYAYLAASLRFKEPYEEKKEGLLFRGGSGRETRVRGFGLGPDVKTRPLMYYGGPDDFVVDLDSESTTHQILLAMMPRPASLAEAVASLEKRIPTEPFHGGASLRAPDVAFGLDHVFAELAGPFTNPAFQGLYLALAKQSVRFRLDRGGAELKAEAVLAVASAAPPRDPPLCHFERPFLLLMKKRGAARPYLVAWVDNPEILDPR
jgi:hypothetical protein